MRDTLPLFPLYLHLSLRPSLRLSRLRLQEMSHLIRTRKAMTSTPSLTTTPTTAATAPAKMDHRPVNSVDPVGPSVP
ncbi:hypothetical protein C1H46_007094 [Malus baccata]|uniref:Uncharacterized protein n=1 Tax=Malus baccata TaxID=106549 RepID=A0A540N892_MALBA|nr:hypothetical protein C1H46_007094 [Malus baccata]